MGRGDFRKIPNGLPGVEERVDLMHQAVVDGRLTKERWVEVVSTAPAKIFGMYPRKGVIAVGADADIVVYDPNRSHVLSASTHHMDVDYSCYEGMTVQGGSDVVMSRGSVVVRDGEFTGRKGHGKFVKRGPQTSRASPDAAGRAGPPWMRARVGSSCRDQAIGPGRPGSEGRASAEQPTQVLGVQPEGLASLRLVVDAEGRLRARPAAPAWITPVTMHARLGQLLG